MTTWYARGEVGEYVLDRVEDVINGMTDLNDFVLNMSALGLDYKEIQTLLLEEELVTDIDDVWLGTVLQEAVH